MDNEMIERCAKILAPMSWNTLNTNCDTKTSKKKREQSLEFSKRFIAAMREPTEKMLEAGIMLGPDKSPDEYWQAMIDAITND